MLPMPASLNLVLTELVLGLRHFVQTVEIDILNIFELDIEHHAY